MKQNKIRECKNYIFAIGVMSLFLFGMTIQANAAPQLELGSATVSQGGTGMLNLSISGGTESYAGVNAKIILPDGITLEEISSSIGFVTDYNLSGNELTIIGYSGDKSFSGTDGVLLTLTVKASDNAKSGDVKFSTVDSSSFVRSWYAISNTDGSKSVEPVIKTGKITVAQTDDTDNDGLQDSWETEYFGNLNQSGTGDYDGDGFTNEEEENNGTDPTIKHGDLNGDKNITTADAVIGLKIICGINPGTFKLDADINGDGKIGLNEIVFILQKVSGLK